MIGVFLFNLVVFAMDKGLKLYNCFLSIWKYRNLQVNEIQSWKNKRTQTLYYKIVLDAVFNIFSETNCVESNL